MRMNLRSFSRLAALVLLLLLVPFRQPSGVAAPEAERSTSGEKPAPILMAAPDLAGARLYHLRFLRARLDSDVAGSALFTTPETIVPLSAQEFWGRSDQAEALKEALGAGEIEAMPGVVVRSGASAEGGPHRFRTGLGEEVVDVTFLAEPLEHGWSRISLRAATDRGEELLDAGLRVADEGTVALVIPVSPSPGDVLVIGVTPLKRGTEPDLGKMIFYCGGDGVTCPRLVSKVDPVYPESARKEKISGRVILGSVIRTDGVPDRLVVYQMPEGGEWLAGTAVETVSKWRYEPARRAGLPVDAYFTIIMEFVLE